MEHESARIRILDSRTVGMISAGEVVERPSSIVKELVENSIDAGSSRIRIELQDAGKELIQVMDDGMGMDEEEILVALERHATSKIVSFLDLQEITTLGFRGEALPSIAAVSRMEILSKPRDLQSASRVIITGGEITGEEKAARTTGTTVTVRDVFYNTPVRKKFLRTKGTELRRIIQVVTEMALSNLAVSFSLFHDGRAVLECEKTDDLLKRVAYLFSREVVTGMIPVMFKQDGMEVYGLISRPEEIKKGKAREYCFVNGRAVRSLLVKNCVKRGFRATLKAGLKPDYFLFLKIPPSDVDVNVHPMKLEVKFRDEERIAHLLDASVSHALSSPESIPSYGRGEPPLGFRERDETRYGAESQDVVASETDVDQMTFLFSSAGKPGAAKERSIESEKPDDEVYYPSMVQIHNTFLVVQTRKGILILDQHASHERVLYEKLIDSFAGGNLTSQKLLFPLTFHLSPSQYSTVMEYLTLFRAFGFDIEPFGGKSIILHSTPSLHRDYEAESTFREMIDDLAESASVHMKEHELMARVIACKAALKAGQALSRQEMCELFDTLFTTRVPSRDIHGRPTMVQIGIDELKKRFERG